MGDWIVHLALGPLLLVIALLFLRFPPRDINWMYGYRTARSMKSQEAWEFANRLSARALVWISVGITLIQALLMVFLNPVPAVLVATVVYLVGVLGLIPVVEIRLKQRFPDANQEDNRTR
ncbi:MAG: SdpI family protein [Verrucomicrobiales bacterium]|nr:SdpI family protein [Verrucomicrobiales bacterium]